MCLAFSSPTWDLAQLILHFNGWAARETVLRAYEAQRPLDRADQWLLPAAALVDLVGEARWSLACLSGDEGQPAQHAAHARNLRVLLRSLEVLVAQLEAARASTQHHDP